MKKDSDNFRQSSTIDLINKLDRNKVSLLIYEPSYAGDKYNGIKVEKDLQVFKYLSDLIVANRIENEIEDVQSKVFSRDIFKKIDTFSRDIFLDY